MHMHKHMYMCMSRRTRCGCRCPSKIYAYLSRLEDAVGHSLPLCYVAMVEATCQPSLEAEGQDALPPLGDIGQPFHWAARLRPMHGFPGMWVAPGQPAPGELRDIGASEPTVRRFADSGSVRLEIGSRWEQSPFVGPVAHVVYLEWRAALPPRYVLSLISDYNPLLEHAEQEEEDIEEYSSFHALLRACSAEYLDWFEHLPVRFRMSKLRPALPSLPLSALMQLPSLSVEPSLAGAAESALTGARTA
mmetsp:Transcript_30033/g.99604  ORF Transcript_30033/g.99604 Transcript_30033/m.99604 type:complete len:247 (-) Transcript_30033:107-847(-)